MKEERLLLDKKKRVRGREMLLTSKICGTNEFIHRFVSASIIRVREIGAIRDLESF